MQDTPREVIIANLAFIAFWALITIFIWLAGGRWKPLRNFRARMIAQWKPALIVTLIYLASHLFSGRSLINPYAIAVFCQALIGLAIARNIPGFEPLAVSQALSRRERVIRALALFLGIGILAGFVGLFIGSFGMGIARSIFHETNYTQEAMGSFPGNKVQAFFLLLHGAGIAEETTYRLVLLSLVWAVTRRRGLAIFVSALLFGAYHLTPLDGMYLAFLRFPISQFIASMLIGLLWGWVFAKRGYETTVLAHTMSDWIGVALFS